MIAGQWLIGKGVAKTKNKKEEVVQDETFHGTGCRFGFPVLHFRDCSREEGARRPGDTGDPGRG
jgi:hypothetical protein